MALSDAKSALADIHQDLDDKKKQFKLAEEKVQAELTQLENSLRHDIQSRVRFDQEITSEFETIRTKLESDALKEAKDAEEHFKSIYDEARHNYENFQAILEEKINQRTSANHKFNHLKQEAERIKSNIMNHSQYRRSNMKTNFEQLLEEMKKKKQDLTVEKSKLKTDAENIASRILEKYEDISSRIEKNHSEKKESGLYLMTEIQATLKESHKQFS